MHAIVSINYNNTNASLAFTKTMKPCRQADLDRWLKLDADATKIRRETGKGSSGIKMKRFLEYLA